MINGQEKYQVLKTIQNPWQFKNYTLVVGAVYYWVNSDMEKKKAFYFENTATVHII